MRRSRLAPPPGASTLPPPPAPDARPVESTNLFSRPAPPPALPPDPEPEPVAEVAAPEPPPSDLPAADDNDIEAAEPVAGDLDLDLDAVLAAVFGDAGTPYDRAERFAQEFAGATVTWTATVQRTSSSRRNRTPTRRAELLLGHLSERELYSERVLAEAYFAPDVELERDHDVTFVATLAEANVYSRRLVLEDARPV
ncbi:MAG: hypothetical protein AAF081_17505 [Actinomycetota bacterium]